MRVSSHTDIKIVLCIDVDLMHFATCIPKRLQDAQSASWLNLGVAIFEPCHFSSLLILNLSFCWPQKAFIGCFNRVIAC